MSSRVAGWALAAALTALVAALSLLDIVSWDYWWQLRAGRWIVEHGAVPDRDPFSYTAPGARWIDVHWLFQLALHGLHALGGHAAVVIGKFVAVGVTLAALAPIGARADRAALSAAALGLVAVLLAERIMPRAELPSFMLLAAVLLALDRMRRPGRRFAWLAIPALQLVWANTHGLFAVGLAVVAIHLVGDLFDRATRAPAPAAPIARLAAALAGGTLVAFVNPNGWRAVAYPFGQLGMIGAEGTRALGATIVELQPTLGNASATMLAAAGLLLAAAVGGLLANRREAPARDWLLLVAFGYLALAARRNLPLFAIVVAPIAVTHLGAWLDRRGRDRGAHDRPAGEGRAGAGARGRLAPTAVVVVALLAVTADVVTGGFHRRLGVPREPGLSVMQTWFSLGAAAWIRENRPPQPIAHALADGGVFIAELHPDQKVMVDGRLEVYGSELLERLLWRTPEEFEALHRTYRFGTVVVHYSKIPSAAMLRWLHRRPAWKLVFVDEVSAVYVRDGGPNPAFAALDVDADDLFPPFRPSSRVQDELRLRGRALFYAALERAGRVRAVVAEARALTPPIELLTPGAGGAPPGDPPPGS